MKKIISIILCIISVFCIVACGNIESIPTTNSTTGTAITSDTNTTVTTASTTATPLSTTGTDTTSSIQRPAYSTSPHHSSSGSATSISYESFEEVTSRYVDTIVKAEIVSVSSYGDDHTKYVFKVNEVLMGDAEGTIDVLIVNRTDLIPGPNSERIYYKHNGVIFYDNTEYLLLLSKSGTVYTKIYPYYVWIRGLVINLNDITLSEMYNQPLANHATGIDINTCTKEELIDYVCELAEGNKPMFELSDAKTPEEMVNDADNVFHIKVKELRFLSNDSTVDNETWSCEVVETIKGEPPINMNQIYVVFFAHTVEAGGEYIVVVEGDGLIYTFITKNSLRPLSEKEEIKGYVN
ncbi:MAG: hypothetical protein IJX27_05740 [Clostridia bacterium]|nr:hypothetical protein [Clostridia bacterium]